MTRVQVTYPGDTIVKEFTALVHQPTTAPAATHAHVGLVEISTPAGPPGSGVVISDTPPPNPVDGTQWWESDTGILWTWYIDADSAQWVQISGGVGGGGGGDDLETTPVAAIGSSVEQTIPEWLAGAPILTAASDFFVTANHRGAWVHLTNNIGTNIYLPEDWLPGQSFGVRQIGTGPCNWTPLGGATMQVPFTKLDHTTILEQYEDVVFRVISNSDGTHAVWSFSGATA